jgi:MFS transporter, Spinster family, sphingosine-1-phosphate transporter
MVLADEGARMAVDITVTPEGKTALPSDTPLPGARLALILLLSINLFNYVDRYVLAAMLPDIQKTLLPEAGPNDDFVLTLRSLFGFGDKFLMGLLTSAFMISYMIFSPLFGWLADRTSRWLLIGIGVILWSLASGASGLAAVYGMMLATRCFVGIGEAAYGPAAPTVIADLYPVKIRGYVLSWFYMAIPVGSALGFVLGGVMLGLASGWGWERPWSAAFYAVVPPGLLLGLLCFFMPEPRSGQADAASRTEPARLHEYRVLVHTPSYVLNTLGMTAMTFAVGGMAAWMPDYIHGYRHHGSLEWVSVTFGGIVVASGLGGTLVGGLLGDWLRGRFAGSYFLVAAAGMFIGFPAFLAALFVPFEPFPWAWICIFVACFCLFLNTGPTNTALANVTHPSIRATAFAVNIFIIHALGDAISPAVIGAISDAANMNVGFLAVSAMIVISGVLWLVAARYLERDTALAPTQLG